ncbi:MAG: NAD(+)/NADH kinase [Planctomycetes bacterium]|nr:NAD(+)/NADH kinase [Planctomycetota bacterium]
MARRVQIIANPIAGGGKGGALAPELVRQLESRGLHAELTLTERAGDARRLARTLEPATHDAVVVVGGDGTLHEVLNGMPDLTLPLAVMPLGTANVLACELGLRADPAAIAEIVDRGRAKRAAVGTIDGGERFLLFAGYGLDGRMVHHLERIRRGTLGKLGWTRPVWHVVRHWPRDEIQVETASGVRLDGLSQILVTRVRNYGGLFTMPGDIDIEDGALHVIGFRQRSRAQFVAATFRAWRGTLRIGRDVEVLTTDALRVEGPHPVPCQLDGDAFGTTPHEIGLERERARILVAE